MEQREKLEQRQRLKQRQKYKSGGGGDGAARLGTPLSQLRLLSGVGREEVQLYTSNADGVAGMEHGRLMGALTVDQYTGGGVDGVDTPGTAIIPADGGMAAGDRGEVDADVAALGTPDDVFPVEEIVPGAVGQTDEASDLAFFLLAEEGPAAANQYDQRQNQQHHAAGPKQGRGGVQKQIVKKISYHSIKYNSHDGYIIKYTHMITHLSRKCVEHEIGEMKNCRKKLKNIQKNKLTR